MNMLSRVWTQPVRMFSAAASRCKNRKQDPMEFHHSLLELLQGDNIEAGRNSAKSVGRSLMDHTPLVPKVQPPRTGALAGRTVAVHHPEFLMRAVRQLNTMNRINQMKQVVAVQRYAERPGKARLRIRIERKRREFNSGIRRLFKLVKRAKRQGY